jgi:hypothetical protein
MMLGGRFTQARAFNSESPSNEATGACRSTFHANWFDPIRKTVHVAVRHSALLVPTK